MSEFLTASTAQPQLSVPQIAKKRNTFITLALITALAIAVIQLLSLLIYPIVFDLRGNQLGISWTSYIVSRIEQCLIALLLPVVALSMHRGNKYRGAKLFAAASIIFLVLQLIASILLIPNIQANSNSMAIIQIRNAISGSRMFPALRFIFDRLFRRGSISSFRSLLNILYELLCILESICFMAKHVFCLLGFIKLAKNK